MKINRNEIFKQILTYKFEQDFLLFIDFINVNNTANEFPTMLYHKFYTQKVRAVAKAQEDSALLNIMSLDSLIDNGIFTYEDKNTGQLAMPEALYSFLTFLDVSRSRQLNNVEFESFRARIEAIVSAMINMRSEDEDYIEAQQHFNTLMANIISAIKLNLEVLENKVSEITVLYQQKEQGTLTISIDDLFQQAQKLYDRNIQPFLEFIDPHGKMKEAETFIESLNKLYHYYQKEQLTEAANILQYKGTSVTSYYKDINKLAVRIRQYLNMLSEDRRYFMVIERAFNTLVESFEPLRHGRTQSRYLNANSKIMQSFTSLDGLSSFRRSYSVCFNRNPSSIILQFKLYLLDLKENDTLSPEKFLKPITDAKETLAFERVAHILNLIGVLPLPEYIEDIYQFVYEYLTQSLDNMTLLDCLHGISCLLSLVENKWIETDQRRNQLTDEQYYLDYLIMSYNRRSII